MSATLYGRSALRIARTAAAGSARRSGWSSSSARRGRGRRSPPSALGSLPGLRRPRRGAAVEGGDSRSWSACPGGGARTAARRSSSGCAGSASPGPPRRRADARDDLRAASRAARLSGSDRRPRRPRRPRRRLLAPRARLAERRAHRQRRCAAEFGPHARFWVEAGRAPSSRRRRDATRAAWAWRRYVTAAAPSDADRRLRYEHLVADPRRRGAGGRSARGRESLVAEASRASTPARQDAGGGTCPRPARRRRARGRRELVALGYELGSTPASDGTTPIRSSSAITSATDSSGVSTSRVGDHLGVVRRLVRVVDAGELFDLARERLRVEPLHVAARALLDRRLDPDLDERPLLLDDARTRLRVPRTARSQRRRPPRRAA